MIGGTGVGLLTPPPPRVVVTLGGGVGRPVFCPDINMFIMMPFLQKLLYAQKHYFFGLVFNAFLSTGFSLLCMGLLGGVVGFDIGFGVLLSAEVILYSFNV